MTVLAIGAESSLQASPPAAETEPQTIVFLTSIFMDWPSARDSDRVTVDTPRTLPFEVGVRVAVRQRPRLGWKQNIQNGVRLCGDGSLVLLDWLLSKVGLVET